MMTPGLTFHLSKIDNVLSVSDESIYHPYLISWYSTVTNSPSHKNKSKHFPSFPRFNSTCQFICIFGECVLLLNIFHQFPYQTQSLCCSHNMWCALLLLLSYVPLACLASCTGKLFNKNFWHALVHEKCNNDYHRGTLFEMHAYIWRFTSLMASNFRF